MSPAVPGVRRTAPAAAENITHTLAPEPRSVVLISFSLNFIWFQQRAPGLLAGRVSVLAPAELVT